MKWLLLLALVVVVGCSDGDEVRSANVIDPQSNPIQTTHHAVMTFSNDGLRKAVLHAYRVRAFEASGYTLLDSGVRVDFYDRDGRHTTTLTSRRGTVYSSTNNMTALDSVRIVSDSGTVVLTDSLEWINRSQQVQSQAFVKITERDGRTTTGTGFTADQNLVHYRILQPTIEAPASTTTGTVQPTLRPAPARVPGAQPFPVSQQVGIPIIDSATR